MLDKLQKSFILPPRPDSGEINLKTNMGRKKNGTKCNAQTNVGLQQERL
jgi:hypothetical protein